MSVLIQKLRVWWFTVLGIIALLEEGLSAISRGTHGKSDLSVFYRTAVLLAHGAGASLYAGRDAVSGWYRCIPPAGMMWFAPLASLSARGASEVWVGFNFVLAALGALLLRAIFGALEREGDTRARVAAPFAVGIFFLMAAPSVEVGQFSLMFVVLWLVALWCAVRHKFEGAAFSLALAAAIKVYPALLLLAPIGVLRVSRWPRLVLAFALGCAFWTWGAPALVYGGRTVALQSAFWHDVVMSPTGRLSESQTVRASANHGLDTVMLRFGANEPEPIGAPPHFNFAPQAVLSLASPVRALLIVLSLGLWWWQGRGRLEEGESHQWLRSFALWSALLFLILPGAKARYAVYAFLAFLPLILQATSLFATRNPSRWIYAAFIALELVLVTSLVSTGVRLWEAGFWGALLLWVENGRLLLQPVTGTQPAPLPSGQQNEGVAMLRAL